MECGGVVEATGARAHNPSAPLDDAPTLTASATPPAPTYLFNGRPACPRQRRMLLLDRNTGEIAPSRCDSQKCAHCVKRHAREMPAIIGWGKPERSLTMTLMPDGWQHARSQLRDWVRRIRADGYALEMAWTTERTKRGDRHLHAATWGDFIPHALAQERWGGRFVYLNALSGSGSGWGAYLGKMVGGGSWSAYMAKDSLRHVADNGGRVLHLTRGYLRGETMTQVREKIRASKDDVERDWCLVTIEELEEYRRQALHRLVAREQQRTTAV